MLLHEAVIIHPKQTYFMPLPANVSDFSHRIENIYNQKEKSRNCFEQAS